MSAKIDWPVLQDTPGNEDRKTTIICSATGFTYPAPSLFNYVWCKDNVGLLLDAAWLYWDALEYQALVSRYATDAWLPG